jgi:hypothetical protein
MTTSIHNLSLSLAILSALAGAGCGVTGKVEQGRVIAYDKQAKRATLIAEAGDRSSFGVLPPVIVRAPENPDEMGPAPAAGKLISLDTKTRRIVIFDAAAGAFRTIPYTPIKERLNVAKAPPAPAIDRNTKTITIYSSAEHKLITFAATDDLLALPADTWRSGDVVRYYYKEPGQALRMMNVTKTDLSKAGS